MDLLTGKVLINYSRKDKKKTMSADGRLAYPPLPMFKLLLLQRWYGLSDPEQKKL